MSPYSQMSNAIIESVEHGHAEPFKTISHPLEFRLQVQQQIEQREQGNQVARVSSEKVLI